MALFGNDLNALYGNKNSDHPVSIVTFVILVLFSLEFLVLAYCKPGYILSSYAVLDLLAAVSLIGDIPWIFDTEHFPNALAAGKAGRVTRSGAKSQRLVRLVRIMKLSRVLRLSRLRMNRFGYFCKCLAAICPWLIYIENEEEDSETNENDLFSRNNAIIDNEQKVKDQTGTDVTGTGGAHIASVKQVSITEPQATVKNMNVPRKIGSRRPESSRLRKDTTSSTTWQDSSREAEELGSKEIMTELAEMSTSKVIWGCLFCVVVLPLLDPYNHKRDDDGILALKQMRKSFLDIRGVDPTWTFSCDRTRNRPYDAIANDLVDSFYQLYNLDDYRDLVYLRVDNVTCPGKNNSTESFRKRDIVDLYLRDDIMNGNNPYYQPFKDEGPSGGTSEGANADSSYLYSTANFDRGDMSFLCTFHDRGQKDYEAKMSMLTTLLLVCLIAIGMTAFSMHSETLSSLLTEPLVRLSKDMGRVAVMDVEISDASDFKVASVLEMRRMQLYLLLMKFGLLAFQKFIPQRVVGIMLREGMRAELKVEYRFVTTYFSDIQGFTSICEKISPHELVSLLTTYFNCQTAVVKRSGGSVLDYVGDAIFACWNAPHPIKNHGWQGVQDSLDMHAALALQREKWCSQGMSPIHTRCGLFSGTCFVGNIGGSERLKYSVLGEGSAMPERLEDGNKKYASRHMITENTRNHIIKTEGIEAVETILLRPVDQIKVNKVDGGVGIWQVVCRRSDATEEIIEWVESYAKAMDLYRLRKFDAAKRMFIENQSLTPPKYVIEMYGKDIAPAMMISRCDMLMREPPALVETKLPALDKDADWDMSIYGAI